jgi:Tol biopolymer transport system component
MSGRMATAGLLALASFAAAACGTGETGGGRTESRLIASSAKGVHLISSDGSGSRLIPGTGGVAEPTWSDDGERVAFSLAGDVYTAQADWSERRLAFESASGPSWSPDGMQLAVMRDSCEAAPDYEECYVALDFDNPVDLYTVGVDGSDSRRLTSAPGYDGDPAWSPDGEWIAFADDDGLSLMRPDGSDRKQLARGDLSKPAWSPDGKTIAVEDSFAEVVLIDVDSGDRTNLTRRQGPDFAPAWSPAGTQIAFLANSECLRTGRCSAHEPWEVWVIDVDGSDARRLTKGGFGPPAWG